MRCHFISILLVKVRNLMIQNIGEDLRADKTKSEPIMNSVYINILRVTDL